MKAIGRILSVSMSVVLVVGLMPLPAYADGHPWDHLESAHPYSDNMSQTWTYSDASAEFGLAVTFDEHTETEAEYDFITIYDENEEEVGSYSGSELAGVTIEIPDSTSFEIWLTSDWSITKWGFKVVDVAPLGDPDDEGDDLEGDDEGEPGGEDDESGEDETTDDSGSDDEGDGGDENGSEYEAVASISFTPEQPYQLVEGVDGRETEGGGYDYDPPEFRVGDVLTVTDSNGDAVEYVYGGCEADDGDDDGEDEWDDGYGDDEDGPWFVSEDGDRLDEGEFGCAWKEPANEWAVGTTYQMVIAYCGCTCEVGVELVANPVASIEFTPHAPYRFLAEGEDEGFGYWNDPADSGEEGEPWFYYTLPWIDEGDKLVVTAVDGTRATYVGVWSDAAEDYVLASGAAVIPPDEVEFLSDQEQVGGWGVGTHQVTVRYMNRMCSVNIEVMEAKSVKNATIAFAKGKTSFPYKGEEIEPTITVKDGGYTLVEDVDYEVSYENNVNVDTSGKKPPKVTVTGLGVYKDGKSATFEITPLSIKGAKLALSKTELIYNKKAQKPSVTTVGGKKLKAGTDYTLKYSNVKSTKLGSYTVQVTGKGNYTGTSAKATYKILNANPVKMTAKKPTVSLAKVKKAKQVVAAKNAYSVTSNKGGKATYKKASGDKAVTVASNGNVTVAKGAKKGGHTVKVTASFAAKGNYASAGKTVTLKVTVK